MKDYARKIYAFAYAKTGNTRDAEDLSQEILLEMCKSDISAARNPDAWVNGLCRHVWARFLNRNKRHWESVGAAPLMDFMAADDDTAMNADRQAEYDMLRSEIAYLSRTRREVLIMYYFDGKSVEFIARKLGITVATVRWHMMKARTELKERLNMENRNGMREKVRLNVGHSGNTMDWKMCGLKDDLLTQNVAWVCNGKKLTIEEISRELGVPAVYLESILERLVEMDYMTVSGLRYTTNFFIWDRDANVEMLKFRNSICPGYAEIALRAWERVKDDIRGIGFIGCDMPEMELKWHLMPMLIEHVFWKAHARMQSEYDLKFESPRRPDGSVHFVHASEKFTTTGDDLLDEIMRDGTIFGIKSRNADGVSSMQYDLSILTEWRDFNGTELTKLRHIVHADGIISDDLKEEAAGLVRDGYVEIDEGRLRLLIPYFTKDQWERFEKLIYAAFTDEDVEVFYQGYLSHMRKMERLIPEHINQNERNWLLLANDDIALTMWHAAKCGGIEIPAPEIARRLATVVFETE